MSIFVMVKPSMVYKLHFNSNKNCSIVQNSACNASLHYCLNHTFLFTQSWRINNFVKTHIMREVNTVIDSEMSNIMP